MHSFQPTFATTLGASRCRIVGNYLFNAKTTLLCKLAEFLRIIVCPARRTIPYNKGDEWRGPARPPFVIGAGQFSGLVDNDGVCG